jgi:hypothetical protein
MPYIGKSPQHGNYSKLDDISSGFDGSDATHALASNSIAITPVRPEALLISINGVIQEPVTDYTVSGTNITFTTAPISTDSFFGVAMGEQLAIGTPSDATVTSAKLSGDLQTPGNLTIAGTTPTLTVGDAGAEDAKIIFDGNAQDFHIGLDDTADDLVIGLGSTLGTTTHMAFDETGAIIKPLQPAFSVVPASQQSNFSTDSDVDIVFGTERFDINADFASNTFTAPVTGKYLLTYMVMLLNIDSAAAYYRIRIVTSNRNYDALVDPDFGQDNVYFTPTASFVCDMDASDTAKLQVRQSGGSAQTDIEVDSRFTGCLLG